MKGFGTFQEEVKKDKDEHSHFQFMNTFIRQKSDRKVKNNRQKYFYKIKKYNISSYDRQSTPNCSYTALTATCRGPGIQRRQSSAE